MRKWSIGKKLGAGFTGLVACIVALGMISLWAANTSGDDLTEMGSRILGASELSGSIHVQTWTVRAELRAMLLAAALHHPQEAQKSRASGEQAIAKLDAELAEIRPLLIDPKAKAAAEGLALMLPQWRDAFGEIADLAAAGKVDAAYKVRAEKEHLLANQIEEGPLTMRAGQRATAEARLAEAKQRAAWNRGLIAASIGIGLLLGLLVFGMVRGMVKTLRGTVKELGTGGEQMSAASTQIASTSQMLSQGASEQAASVEEISASMEEMTAMARRNGDSSAEATAMMLETAKQVERSHVALADMVSSMNAIKASSEKVAKINKTIDEIAFQTNILALNAAVEAARAGEAGMGFAVVADEVRNLAQRSAVAAKDTAALIEESIGNSNQGAQRLEQVSTAIRGITESAGKVKSLLDEVNESSKQQGQGITQVSTAIQQVSTVTQTSAASAEESAAAAEELSAQSQNVRELVNGLAAMVEGAREEDKSPRTVSRVPVMNARFVKKATAKQDEDPFPMESGEPGSFRSF